MEFEMEGGEMDKPVINYEGKRFIALSVSESGEVSGDTVFYYHQKDDLFWAEYTGGLIRKGFMIGVAHPDGSLEFSYQHMNNNGEIRIGKCQSNPEILSDGRIRLHERWQWLDGNIEDGVSIVEEMR